MPIGSSKVGVLGAGLVAGGTVTFNASGTFSVPPGVRSVNITGKGGAGNPGTAGNPGNPGNPGTGGAGGSTNGAQIVFCGYAGAYSGNSGGFAWKSQTPGGYLSFNQQPYFNNSTQCWIAKFGTAGYYNCNSAQAGQAGKSGQAGSAGNAGGAGNPGNSSSGLSKTFPGGSGGNAGVGGNAGNAGNPGPAGGTTGPGLAGSAGSGNCGGGSGGNPFTGYPGGNSWFVSAGKGGGGAGSYTSGQSGGNPVSNPPAGPNLGQLPVMYNYGTAGGDALTMQAPHPRSSVFPTAMFGGQGGGQGQAAINLGCTGRFAFWNFGPQNYLNPAWPEIFRAGGGGGGPGNFNNPANGYMSWPGGGGGGGRGGVGGCGGAANTPSGSSATPITHKAVPVTPGGSYPITVASPGGQVVISWDPQ